MKVVYAGQSGPESWTSAIFLAGPTPRDASTPSWRPQALHLLEQMGYTGVVFVPEPADGKWLSGGDAYQEQVEWERQCLDLADVIVFWVPRVMGGQHPMPALTTNVEFGLYVSSDKVVLGAPAWADSIRYLETLVSGARHQTLEATLQAALDRIGQGAVRVGGERGVPLHIWNLPSFQSWYGSLCKAGNRLDEAKLLWHFRPQKAVLAFCFVLKVWIASEGRWKENEFVFTRTDISTVVLYHHDDKWAEGSRDRLLNTRVVLIREFRSPARTQDGFIRELPGGSSAKPNEDPLRVASDEVHEETGLIIPAGRIRSFGSRQVCGTLSSHHAHLFAAELTDVEMEQALLLAQQGEAHGVEEDSERTYVEIHTYGDLLQNRQVDWSTLGLISSVLLTGSA